MRLAAILTSIFAPCWAMADPAMIENVIAQQNGGSWSFSVTLRHPDTGWDHYADGWEVISPDGTVLGFRKLLHPHETEQPFTRSLGGVEIPVGMEKVQIRAKCSVDGWTSEIYEFELNR